MRLPDDRMSVVRVQVVSDHELVTCCPGEAMSQCNERMFQLIWVHLPFPPSHDVLSVVAAIRYKTVVSDGWWW